MAVGQPRSLGRRPCRAASARRHGLGKTARPPGDVAQAPTWCSAARPGRLPWADGGQARVRGGPRRVERRDHATSRSASGEAARAAPPPRHHRDAQPRPRRGPPSTPLSTSRRCPNRPAIATHGARRPGSRSRRACSQSVQRGYRDDVPAGRTARRVVNHQTVDRAPTVGGGGFTTVGASSAAVRYRHRRRFDLYLGVNQPSNAISQCVAGGQTTDVTRAADTRRTGSSGGCASPTAATPST
jgi:hypothetical protein